VRERRVLVLFRKGLEPPDTIEGLSDEAIAAAPWKTEYDVGAALENRGLEAFQPHIAFNLLEEFGGQAAWDHHVVSYLELIGLPYTGCNPRGLMLARDKALSKKLLAYHRIRAPQFAVFARGRKVRRPRRLTFPLFVKGVREDASLGISQASLVRDDASLAKRVAFVHEHAGGDAIAEEYIEGREIYLSLLGNHRLDVFPLWELIFEHRSEDTPLIATARAKWNLSYQKKWGVISRQASDLPPELARHLAHQARRIYRILGLSGYARLDFRLSPEGAAYFLEANPNPQLAYGEDFAESADKRGLSYEQLLERILSLGLRWQAVP
jgi:D-alanine-D-alanine ligase